MSQCPARIRRRHRFQQWDRHPEYGIFPGADIADSSGGPRPGLAGPGYAPTWRSGNPPSPRRVRTDATRNSRRLNRMIRTLALAVFLTLPTAASAPAIPPDTGLAAGREHVGPDV